MHSGLQNTNAPRDKSNGVIKQYLSPRDISRVSYTISESQDFKGGYTLSPTPSTQAASAILRGKQREGSTCRLGKVFT